MQDKTILSLFAIICVTILEVCALLSGIDGTYFMLVLAVIGGIAGYEIKAVRNLVETKGKK